MFDLKKSSLQVPSEKVKITTKGNLNPMQTLATLEMLLPLLIEKGDPVIAKHSSLLVKKMPDLKKLFSESFIGCQGLKLDFILMVHASDPIVQKNLESTKRQALGLSPEQLRVFNENSISESQRKAISVIVKNKYNFILPEGNFADGAGIESLAEEFYHTLVSPENTLIRAEYEKLGANLSSFQSAKSFIVKYLRTVSTSNTSNALRNREIDGYSGDYFGAEDSDLNELNAQFIRISTQSGKFNKSQDTVLLASIRSQYAIAKAIMVMRKYKLKKGAIVFGSFHAEDFYLSASYLGLDSVIWNTDPTIRLVKKN